MILSSEFWRKNPDVLTDKPYAYMVLDIHHMADSDTLEKFEYSLNVLNMRNAFEMINHLWQNMGVNRSLDTSIFRFVTDSVYSESSISADQVKHYFVVMKEFEEVVKAFRAFNANLENVYLQDNIELVLLGIPFNIQKANTDKLDAQEGILDQYSTEKYKYYEGEIDLKTFLSKAEKLCEEILRPGSKAA